MKIREKFLLIITAVMLIILLISYGITYSYFYTVIFKETMQNQRINVELNRRMANNFLESIYYTAVQLVNDKALGDYLSISPEDPLDAIRVKFSIEDQFFHYATHQIVNNIYNYRTTLFLSDQIPISESFEAKTLRDDVSTATSSIFSNTNIKNENWFQETVKNGISVFLHNDTNEFCIARKITNNYYIGPHDKNGMAVLVVSVPINQLEQVFSSIPVTENSSFAILNENGHILYRSNDIIPQEQYLSALNASNQGKIKEFPLHEDGHAYQVNYCDTKYGIQFLFLIPDSDIKHILSPLLTTYTLIFFGIALSILLVIYIVIFRLSRSIIRFSSAVNEIQDTRSFDCTKLHVSNEKELIILEKSFSAMIENINHMIEDIHIQNQREKRSQLRALQAQINPHFLFNTMDIVNWMALSRGCDDIAGIVSSIANMMRYSITDSDSIVPISVELSNIREFLSIYRLRHHNILNLNDTTKDDTIQIPKFTLQPLVENSVRHAKPLSGEILEITILARKENNLSIIEIHDNGIGCDSDELNRHLNYCQTNLTLSTGFGIRNVNERIRLYFGGDSCLSYKNESDGTLTAQIILDHQYYHPPEDPSISSI